MGACFKIQYTVHMALASFVRDGQLPTFTNDLFHCNFHAEQGMVVVKTMNAVQQIDLQLVSTIKNVF